MRGASKDEETQQELKTWYCQTLPKRVEALTQHLGNLREGSSPEAEECVLRQIAHLLRGSGATYGFPEISKMAATTEDASSEKLPEMVEKLIETLQQFAIDPPA